MAPSFSARNATKASWIPYASAAVRGAMRSGNGVKRSRRS
jgi:hypothetical protein